MDHRAVSLIKTAGASFLIGSSSPDFDFGGMYLYEHSVMGTGFENSTVGMGEVVPLRVLEYYCSRLLSRLLTV